MSVQFGKVHFDGKPVDPKDLDQVRPVLGPLGPDGEGYICQGNVGVLYRAFHTTKESRGEIQPHIYRTGSIVTWDGRLDNRDELVRMSDGKIAPDSADVSIVAWAYERWGVDAFSRFIGDWALAVWDAKSQALFLAKDFLGCRHLYYCVVGHEVTWCTILDPLVLFARHSLVLEEEYIAGWLSFFPATHLTPYAGIRSVPAGCFVCLANQSQQTKKYWSFDSSRKIRYRTDAEYEDNFRGLLVQSVERRLRSDNPILAELSGGIDSSTIVCVADSLIDRNSRALPRLDTLSNFDDSEPNWNERPYFTLVEMKRGRGGWHVDVAGELLDVEVVPGCFAPLPGTPRKPSPARESFTSCIRSQGYRVLLSGVGGDEVTGGVPTPVPELADLVAKARLGSLLRQLKLWALTQRRPWHRLLLEAVSGFLPSLKVCTGAREELKSWLHPDFLKRHHAAICGDPSRHKLTGPPPSLQHNLSTLEYLKRQLGCTALPLFLPYEKRYPYLDRDLLEFLFAIPRDQVVRPGRRRSLMRRALAGLVPDEILNRQRKGFVIRAPMAAIVVNWNDIQKVVQHMISAELGIVDAAAFRTILQRARSGFDVPVVAIMRTLEIELWLRNLCQGQTRAAVSSQQSIVQSCGTSGNNFGPRSGSLPVLG